MDSSTFGAWIKINDQLPPPNVGVLVTDGKVITAASLDYIDGKPWWWDAHGYGGYEFWLVFSDNFDGGAVTHWMPLPDFPPSDDADFIDGFNKEDS